MSGPGRMSMRGSNDSPEFFIDPDDPSYGLFDLDGAAKPRRRRVKRRPDAKVINLAEWKASRGRV